MTTELNVVENTKSAQLPVFIPTYSMKNAFREKCDNLPYEIYLLKRLCYLYVNCIPDTLIQIN